MEIRPDQQAEQIQLLVKRLAALEVAALDYQRALRSAEHAGIDDQTIARTVRIPRAPDSVAQAATHSVVRAGDPVPGFSGAGPYEICQRYAAGLLTRDELMDELTRWTYGKQGSTAGDGIDDLIVDEPGSWSDVTAALRHGVIDASLYDEVLDAVSPESSDD